MKWSPQVGAVNCFRQGPTECPVEQLQQLALEFWKLVDN